MLYGNVLGVFLIIFAVINLAFAGLVYFHSTRARTVLFYVLISVFASLWSIATLLTLVNVFPFEVFAAAANLHYIFGYIAYLSFFWFALYYPTGSRIPFVIPSLISVITVGLLFFIPTTEWVIKDILQGESVGERIVFNLPGYIAFIAMLTAVFLAGIGVLWAKIRATSKTGAGTRQQILFALLANLTAGSLGIVFNLVFPLFGNFSFFYINPILVTTALTGIGLYNLMRFNLFNLKVIFAEVLTVGIWVILLARTIASSDAGDRIINAILLLVTVVFGILLVRSVLQEVKAREEVERLARELAAANEKLKELDQRKSEFLSLASHQLRSPLTAIKGYVSMLIEGSFGTFPPTAREALDRVFVSSDRLVKVVEDFLTISRIEQNRLKYEFQTIDLCERVRDIVREFRPTIEKKGLVLKDRMGENERCDIVGDSGKLSQVIGNLIDNAIKYTKEGGITISTALVPGKSLVRLAVADTGVGVDKEDAEKLFQKFSRADGAFKVNASGTGLGLYIAKQIVDAHHGRIWVESEGKGKGSTFYIELPLAPRGGDTTKKPA
ncbi:MAG: hypothetical protein HY457_00140 [Parcubacteria group bacterium]|nr:hypothetical protein [Parcubacteria group bacterium]